MELYSENKNYKLYNGNMLDILEVIEPNTIDSIVTDPPYELNFMGKGWDNAGISFQKETWRKCYEVLKPGGYLLAFGGSRTYHRIACAIEDAGFEIRDTIMWLYGSGFPKSMNIGLAIDKKLGKESKVIGTGKSGSADTHTRCMNSQTKNGKDVFGGEYEIKEATNEWKGWGTSLKPSFEPIIVARKPFKGSLVDNVLEYGVGGLNIDECRVANNNNEKLTRKLYDNPSWKNCSKAGQGSIDDTSDKLGRFPANTILTYDDTDYEEVCGGFPNTKSGKGILNSNRFKTWKEQDGIKRNLKEKINEEYGYNDSGSASRYFYCAKASKRDRDEGLEEFNNSKVNDGRIIPIDNPFQRGETFRKNTHPTVKPTKLMQYLVRLVTPNGGTVLDPFNGSGSTGKAVMYENKDYNKNYKYIGIELTEEYLPIAKARIEYACKEEKEENGQMTIFDLEKGEE